MNSSGSYITSVKQYLLPLMNEYNYSMEKRLSNNDPWSDGEIRFFSSTTNITLSKNRDSIDVILQPRSESSASAINLIFILGALSVVRVEDYIGKGFFGRGDSHIGKMANLLFTHCLPEIEGDFSRWRHYFEYKIHWYRDIMKSQPSMYRHVIEYYQQKWGSLP